MPVVGVDSAVATFVALCFVIGAFDPEPPLLQGGLAIALEPLGGGTGCGKAGRLHGGEEGPGDGFVDLN
jgi:hypothetical protein